MQGLIEGRIVHYVLGDGPSQGEHRPAIIVKVWNQETGCCNLQVFADNSNDGFESAVQWRTSILPDEILKAGQTWHWPEKS